MVSGTKSISVLVVAVDSLVSYSLKKLLSGHPDIAVTTVVDDNISTIIELATELLPDVVIIDIITPQFDLIKQIKASSPITNVIVLTTENNANFGVQAFKAGVSSVLYHSAPVEQIPAAIKAVSEGKVVIEPMVANYIADHFSYSVVRNKQAIAREQLTEREMDTLRLVGRGYTNKQIALELNLGERTVKAHVANILSKLGVQSRSQAIVIAIKQKLIPINHFTS